MLLRCGAELGWPPEVLGPIYRVSLLSVYCLKAKKKPRSRCACLSGLFNVFLCSCALVTMTYRQYSHCE